LQRRSATAPKSQLGRSAEFSIENARPLGNKSPMKNKSRRAYRVQIWQRPHWVGIGAYPDLDSAISFAEVAGAKVRITEFPSERIVWQSGVGVTET
jgi:hypothetical protein